ncbi:MAG: hypothetical protein DRQ44_07655, partial [Gammaproteobacteria bacterium]
SEAIKINSMLLPLIKRGKNPVRHLVSNCNKIYFHRVSLFPWAKQALTTQSEYPCGSSDSVD